MKVFMVLQVISASSRLQASSQSLCVFSLFHSVYSTVCCGAKMLTHSNKTHKRAARLSWPTGNMYLAKFLREQPWKAFRNVSWFPLLAEKKKNMSVRSGSRGRICAKFPPWKCFISLLLSSDCYYSYCHDFPPSCISDFTHKALWPCISKLQIEYSSFQGLLSFCL